MTIATYFQPINTRAEIIEQGETSDFGDTEIYIEGSYGNTRYIGTFFYDSLGQVTGTLDRLLDDRNGAPAWELTDINADMADIVPTLVVGESATPLIKVLFAKGDVVYGSGGADKIDAFDGNDKMFGGTGGDTLWGGRGRDKLNGEGGKDTLIGGKGADTLKGGASSDKLMGGKGADTLKGGKGGDKLIGGKGQDFLTGDGGADIFVFNSKSESGVGGKKRDVITDFKAGTDLIDLAGLDAGSGSGDQAFEFIGGTKFTGAEGELRANVAGGNTIVSGDLDGDGSADFQIQLVGDIALTSDMFVL